MRIKYSSILFWSIAGISVFAFLQLRFSYFFHYEEQLRMFLFTSEYACQEIMHPGGLSMYIGCFIQQLFYARYAGAMLSALMIICTGVLLSRMRPASSSTNQPLCDCLAILPMTLLLYLHTDYSYDISGTIALLFCLIGLYIYQRLKACYYKTIAAFLMTCLLYCMAGPYFLLFTIGTFLFEMAGNTPNRFKTLLGVVIACICCVCHSYFGIVQEELRMTVLPDCFYETSLSANTIYYLWITVLVALCGIHFIQKFRIKPFFTATIAYLILGCGLWQLSEKYSSLDLYMYERDYYLRHHQWDQIVKTFSRDKASNQTMNALNLALACRSELDEKMFSYPQTDENCLISRWNSTLIDALINTEIYYQTGDIASAMKFAFEGYVSSPAGNPRLLMTLIKANIVAGNYLVAKKYISLLRKTMFYRDWASEQMKYLSDEAIEKQHEYITKRREMKSYGTYTICSQTVSALEQQFVSCPENRIAFQYLTGYLLLKRDLNRFRGLYENYYGHSEHWQELSKHQQEAIVALEQEHPGKWAKMGVSMSIEQAYFSFSQDMADKHNALNFAEEMERLHGNSYWFYLIFKKKGGNR